MPFTPRKSQAVVGQIGACMPRWEVPKWHGDMAWGASGRGLALALEEPAGRVEGYPRQSPPDGENFCARFIGLTFCSRSRQNLRKRYETGSPSPIRIKNSHAALPAAAPVGKRGGVSSTGLPLVQEPYDPKPVC